jgi:predicted small secreted protein
MKRFPLFMLIGLCLMTSLAGCNTVHGAGQDVSDVGHSIKHAAD